MRYSELLIPNNRENRPHYKELILNYLKRAAGVFTIPYSTIKSLTPALDQKAFNTFYDTNAPRLWGLILTANLPAPQAETILLNTLIKAWQQFDHHSLTKKQFIAQLIGLACREGLPPQCLQAVFKPKS